MPNPPDKKPASTNSTNPWIEQKADYEAAARSPLDRWLIDITFNSPRIRDAKGDQKLRGDLIEWIGSWRKLLATRVNMQVSDQQITDEVDFMIQYFPVLTLKELEWIKVLYMQRYLPLEYGDIVVFNPDFLAKIVKAYRSFKREKSQDLLREVERVQHWRRSQGTPEMNADGMRYMIERVEREIREGTIYVYMLRDVYNYLERTGQIDPGRLLTGQMNNQKAREYVLRRREALVQVQGRSRTEVSTKDLLKGFSLTKEEMDRLNDTLITEWALKEFFATHPVKEVLEKVSAKHWEPNKPKK